MQAHKDAALGPSLHTYLRPDTVDQASPQASTIVDQPSAQASATDLASARDTYQSAGLATATDAGAAGTTLRSGPAAVLLSKHAVAVPEAAQAAPQEAVAAATAASGAAQVHAVSAAPLEGAAAAMNGTVQAQAMAASASALASAGSAADAGTGQQAKEEDPSAVSLRLVHSAAKLGLKVRQLSLRGNRRMLAGCLQGLWTLGGNTDRGCCMCMRGGNTLTRLHLCFWLGV